MSKGKQRQQHHPFFAEMLRLRLQQFFDVRTNFAVGDTPREADIVLVQLNSDQPTTCTGLWRHLAPRNVIEFKGPTVSARIRDLDLLVELGLGIDRRLNEEETRNGRDLLPPEQMSFWYIVRSIGRRFLRDARLRLGQLEEIGPGLWRSQILQRLVFLVSSDAYPTEEDSIPLHLMVRRAPAQERELARVIVENPELLQLFSAALSSLHPEVWREVLDVVQSRKTKGLKFDFSAVIETIGLEGLLEAVGVERVAEAIDFKKVIKKKGVDWLLARLTPEQIQEIKRSK